MLPRTRSKVEKYAKQRNIRNIGDVGWGIKVTPRQRKRLQRSYTKELKAVIRQDNFDKYAAPNSSNEESGLGWD